VNFLPYLNHGINFFEHNNFNLLSYALGAEDNKTTPQGRVPQREGKDKQHTHKNCLYGTQYMCSTCQDERVSGGPGCEQPFLQIMCSTCQDELVSGPPDCVQHAGQPVFHNEVFCLSG